MTKTVKTSFGSGGAGLTPGSSSVDDLVGILRGLIDDIDNALAGTVSAASGSAVATGDVSATAAAGVSAVATGDSVVTAVGDLTATAVPAVSSTDGVADGLVTGAPTTPSSQAVNPGGETDWNVNISAGYIFVNSVGKYFAAQVDFDVSSAVKIMEIGEAMYAWLVCAEAAGVVTQEKVLGTAAALGAETIPDDAAITAGIGHANWVKLALLHASRTADAVVGTTEDASYLVPWGGAGAAAINELQTKAADTLALANDIKAKYNAAVTLINEIKTRAGESKTLTDELKNDLGEARALANANKAAINILVTLANALKTSINAEGAYTQTVQKG